MIHRAIFGSVERCEPLPHTLALVHTPTRYNIAVRVE
jgi:hypothetical protein